MKRLFLPAGLALVLHGALFATGQGWLKNRLGQKPRPSEVVTLTLDYKQIPKTKPKPISNMPESRPKKSTRPEEKKKEKLPWKKNYPKQPPNSTLKSTKSTKSTKAPKPKLSLKKPSRPKKKTNPSLPPENKVPPKVIPESVQLPKPEFLHEKAQFFRTEKINDVWAAPSKEIVQQEETSKPIKQTASVTPVRILKIARPLYLKNPPPKYPRMARKRGYEGTVVLEVLVDRKGKVSDLRVLESSGHKILDVAALRSVRDWFFEPGMRGDEKVETKVRIPVRFEIK